MVVGSGLVAKAFESYGNNDDTIIYAAGVSNSKSTDETEYDREYALLKKVIETNPEKKIIYFSTCSVYDPVERQSAYVTHKLKLEQYIQSTASRYLIFRVSNLVGKTGNPNTIINFLIHNITTGTPFNLWTNATRNLVGIDDFFKIADYAIRQNIFENAIINIANPENYLVSTIVSHIERFFHASAVYHPIIKGTSFHIDIQDTQPLFAILGINFGGQYMDLLLQKYFSNEL